MFEAMNALAERSLAERLVLFANHVIRAEPEAMRRLALHAGKTVAVEFAGWPAFLPSAPSLALRITPPGLLERLERPVAHGAAVDAAAPAPGGEPPADLTLRIDAANPAKGIARWVLGDRPEVSVEGDEALATEMSWLAEHLRWDVEEDLSRVVGDGPAHAIADIGGAVARGLRDGARKLDRAIDGLARGPGPPPKR